MANVKDLLVNGSARVIGTIYGNATSANKLNTNAGSASQPVYFSNGIPVAITGSLSNNAASATKLLNARNFKIGSTSKSFNGTADVTWTHAEIGATVSNTWTGGTTAGPTLKTTVNGVTGTAVAIPSASTSASGVVTTGAQSFAGDKTFTGMIYFPNVTSGLATGIQWTVGDNDFARIRAGATGSNGGYLEIATADDANEPIYVRQYSGVFGTLKRTLTLLDTSGNTYIPGSLYDKNNQELRANLFVHTIGAKTSSGTEFTLRGLNTAGSEITALTIPNASTSVAGLVTTGTQTFAGVKTFNNNVYGDFRSLTSDAIGGYLLYTDPTFMRGSNNIGIYNNTNNGNVVHERIARPSDCPSASDYVIKITTNGTASPGYGGFYQTLSSRADAQFIVKYLIKLPTGYRLVTASNPMGDGFSDKIISDNAGTGQWKIYTRYVKCGTSGSFSSGGHLYVESNGGAAPSASAPLVWYLGGIWAYDITRAGINSDINHIYPNFDGQQLTVHGKLKVENKILDSSGSEIKASLFVNTIAQNAISGTAYSIKGVNTAGNTITTLSLPIASASQCGLITNAAQEIGGNKTFNGSSLFKGVIESRAGTISSSTSYTYPGGGYYATANPNMRFIGDGTYGISTIEFVSQKNETSINKPSDCAYIQFQPYGHSALAGIGSQPTLASSGESNKLIIGVNNDADDMIYLQTPSNTGLRHIVGTGNYVIPHTGNTSGSVGSATQPVYLNGGVITAITGSIANNTTGSSASCTGNAATATKLATARTIQTNLASTTAASFDGSANITPGVTGTLPVSHGGTGQTTIANIQAGKDGDGNTITSKYVSIYNSNNIGQSSSVTVNDLAKQGSAVGMIYAATDNPFGKASWVHVWSQAWNKTVNSSWVSQIALGVDESDGMWYRTKEGTIVGAAWKKVLDSNNYTSYTVTKTGSGASGTWGINISGNAATASKVNNKLTVGSKNYDGSAAVTITASDLGLASAMLFLGTTTTAITDGAKTNPISIGGSNKTVTAGNVVLYGNKEFVWNGSSWEELGNEGSYKIVQSAVASPSASGTEISFIDTISQNANGVITATKKTVRDASASQSGVVSTGTQTFAGVKTFNNRIVLKDGNTMGAQIGAAYITTANTSNGEVVLQNGHLRFGGSGWDYNQWAGLKYVHSSKAIYLGLADGSIFTANSAQSGGTLYLPGIRYLSINGKIAIDANDSWLRINEGKAFSTGVYFGSNVVRTDGQFQVGSNGSAFYANNGGNGYFSNSLTIAGTNPINLYGSGSGTYNRSSFYIDTNGIKLETPRASDSSSAAILPLYINTRGGQASLLAAGAVGSHENTYIAYPKGGSFRTNSATQTGYLKITLPQSWTNTMMSFKIQFYEYSTGRSCEYTVGGYNYSGSNGTWTNNPFAYSVGKNDNRAHSNLTVRFGHDGSKCAIYIGEADTSWSYMQVQVHSIIVGYSNYEYTKWANGWSVGFTTTLGTITATITNPNTSHYAANAGNADTVDGLHANAFMRAVNANGYYGMARPDGNISDWIRTTSSGMLPYQSGAANAGHQQLGTSSWYFADTWSTRHNAGLWVHTNKANSGTDGGITLYNSEAQYGIMFRQTSNLGTHGWVNSDWATYFTMSNSSGRGWVFRRWGSGNVLSISTDGNMNTNGAIYAGNYIQSNSYFKSNVATGTSPIQVSSTTLNTNLNADMLDGYHLGEAQWAYSNTYTQPTAGAEWYLKIQTGDWNGTSETIYLNGSGNNRRGTIILKTGSRQADWWGYATSYNGTNIIGVKKIVSNSDDVYIRMDSACTQVVVKTTFSPRISASTDNSGYTSVPDTGGFFANRITVPAITGNASTATKLATARTIWGQSFNGTANISGNMTGVGNINTASAPAGTVYMNNWFRSTGKTGWYNETYGGGLYMTDSTYLRNYAGKSTRLDNLCLGADNNNYRLYVNGNIRSTDRIYANEWIQFDNYTGLYSPNNNAHFYPNNSTTYGQWKILGSKGGYSGIQLGDTAGYMTLMDNGNDKGLYQENQGKWLFYYNAGNQRVGIRTASLTGYAITCEGDIYCRNGWLRTDGNRGWYNETYGGGWYMSDSTYVRSFNNKMVYSGGKFLSPSTASSWIDGQRYARAAYNIEDATDSGSYWPWMRQTNSNSGKWFSFGTLGTSFYWIGSSTSRTENHYDYGMQFNIANGYLTGCSKVYGAVWNDYAEYRKSDVTEPGRVVIENGDGTLSLSTKRLQRGAEVISDTYGFAIGETDECKTPIAATGRVLAYTYEPVEEYKSKTGWPVCSGPNGTVSIMTEEEEEKYPSRIIGTISEVPNYEEWGTGKVKTNGRVWIRIK